VADEADQLRVISEHVCYDGTQRFIAHDSRECGTEMRFSVYLPPQSRKGPVPVLYYLAGLTCTEETFMIKAGAQRLAAEHGLMLVAPDTSPRSPRLPGDDASWDFGLGAGFYVDATVEPWSAHYRMYSYVTSELPALINENFPAIANTQGIFGHSMGGHGALVCALRNPERYKSVSAFAPISAPMRCPWGQKAFTGYLGASYSKAGVQWFGVHRACGYTVLVLVVFRIAWGFAGTLHARFSSFVRGPHAVLEFLRGGLRDEHTGHNPVGGWSMLALLAVLALQGVSGLFANDEVASSGPLYGWISHAASNRWTRVHHLNSDAMAVLIGMHVLAIAWYAWVRRKPLVRAMVTGMKPASTTGAAIGRTRWMRVALIVLAACAALAHAVNTAPEADVALF
jgi:S-formylglutathione hydrolase